MKKDDYKEILQRHFQVFPDWRNRKYAAVNFVLPYGNMRQYEPTSLVARTDLPKTAYRLLDLDEAQWAMYETYTLLLGYSRDEALNKVSPTGDEVHLFKLANDYLEANPTHRFDYRSVKNFSEEYYIFSQHYHDDSEPDQFVEISRGRPEANDQILVRFVGWDSKIFKTVTMQFRLVDHCVSPAWENSLLRTISEWNDLKKADDPYTYDSRLFAPI